MNHFSITTKERRRVETALRQFHLPKMAEKGFVHYDRRRKTTQLAVPASTYTDYLDSVPSKTSRAGAFCTAFGVVSIAVFALTRFVSIDVGAVIVSGYLLLFGIVFALTGALYQIGASPAEADRSKF